MYTTHFNPSTPTLSQILYIVATTSTRIRLFSWNQPKIHVPLHQLFDSYVSSFLIMIFGFWLVMEKGSQCEPYFFSIHLQLLQSRGLFFIIIVLRLNESYWLSFGQLTMFCLKFC